MHIWYTRIVCSFIHSIYKTKSFENKIIKEHIDFFYTKTNLKTCQQKYINKVHTVYIFNITEFSSYWWHTFANYKLFNVSVRLISIII